MAYPTGLLSITLNAIDEKALQLKSYANNTVAALNGTVTSSQILGIYSVLSDAKAKFQAAAAVPGIAAYARAQKNDEQLDVGAEFTAMVAAIDTCRTWISTNFPKDGSNYLLAQTLGASGPVDRTFNSATTVALKTALTNLAATIS